MIYQILFVLCLGLFTALYLYWGFTRLTAENRQIFAAMPKQRIKDSFFQGVNFTWYGLLSANGVCVAVILFLILSSSMGTPIMASLCLITLLLSVLLPSARWIARIVEKKKHTFTIGGSVFTGILISPWVICGFNHFEPVPGFRFPIVETLAAFAISYSLGESLGRLSCVSFGCCYGKALSETHPLLQRFFSKHHFIYRGATRKACYASGLEGVKVLPIQAVTSVIYAVSALIGLGLFFAGHPGTALVLTLGVTQTWRSFSEFFRADYRGEGTFSAYQIMGIIAGTYALVIALIFRQNSPMVPDIAQGLLFLWNPLVILTVQGLWLVVFMYMGKSTVTESTLHFHVVKDHI
ncbi:MAG: prolipoprotein diacylglyceryl transferase [Proteobacteria bacterium]|nr:prolipoprotein diacylglyceryl transferase [Pseudomonadota bacterium]